MHPGKYPSFSWISKVWGKYFQVLVYQVGVLLVGNGAAILHFVPFNSHHSTQLQNSIDINIKVKEARTLRITPLNFVVSDTVTSMLPVRTCPAQYSPSASSHLMTTFVTPSVQLVILSTSGQQTTTPAPANSHTL